MKLDGRQTRSNSVAPLLPGASAAKDDYKKAGRVSDAKLQFCPAYSKINSATPILTHTASLIKTVCQYKSYDVSPIWAEKPGKPHLSISLKYDIGPLGPRISLDPDKLIAGDTEAVLDYISAKLSVKYPDLTASASKWIKVCKELAPTIENSHKVFLGQSARKSNKDNSDDTDNVNEINE